MKASTLISRGGILTALGVILIYLSAVSPTSKIYILGIASSLIPLAVIITDIRTSFLIYAATTVLGFLLLGFKGSIIAYAVFFGLYGLIKYYIERLRNIPLEIILKFIYFNFSFGIIYLLYKLFLANLIRINLPLYQAAIMLQFIFIIFDYALTLFITYINKFSSRLSKNGKNK